MAIQKRAKFDPNVIKIAIFCKNYNSPSGEMPSPPDPRLWHLFVTLQQLARYVSQFGQFKKIIVSSSASLANSWLHADPDPGFCCSFPRHLYPIKSTSFQKVCMCHRMWFAVYPLPNQKSRSYVYGTIRVFKSWRTSVLLVLIFILAVSHASAKLLNGRWRPKGSRTKSSASSRRLTLQFPTVEHSSGWLHLSIQFMQTMKSRGDKTHPCWSPTPI